MRQCFCVCVCGLRNVCDVKNVAVFVHMCVCGGGGGDMRDVCDVKNAAVCV